MNKVSKKSLKPTKKSSTKLEKTVKSLNNNDKLLEMLTVKPIENSTVEIEENLKFLRGISNESEIKKDVEKPIKAEKKKSKKMEVVVSENVKSFTPKNSVANKRIVIVKNIPLATKIEDILATIKCKDEISQHKTLKIRNHGVKTQMLTIEFKSAHHTESVVAKLNGTIVDGSLLTAEYKATLVTPEPAAKVVVETSKTFIIKNLPLHTTAEYVQELMKDIVAVPKSIDITKKFGKNCCFLKFNTIRDASMAFVLLQDTAIDGVKLDVKYVKEVKEEVDEGEFSKVKLHITNLPFTWKKEEVEKELCCADSIKFPLTAHGKPKGSCFLFFQSEEMAALALSSLKDKVIDGRTIKCSYAKNNVAMEEDSVKKGNKKKLNKKKTRGIPKNKKALLAKNESMETSNAEPMES